jgi:uncharacterized protein with NAD-binding domain and iron-sulfur cluster
VIVIGGGVAGMSAAHELIERGFQVDIYEMRPAWGGKARSQPVPGTGTRGRKDLPGEHGFRFYPRFYRHVIDTMARIPLPAGGFVADRLRATTETAIALVDDATWFRFHRKRLQRPYEILETLELFFQELDFDQVDVALFAAKILQFATTCEARRAAQLEYISWWDFLEAERYSPSFQRQLRAIPRTMVAMDPRHGSARSLGIVSMQLLADFGFTGVSNDRTLGGPSSELWFDPWVSYLRERGARLHDDTPVASLELEGTSIARITLRGGATATADYYVLAVPLDAAQALISPEMGAVDPALERLRTGDVDSILSWMVGIQYFLLEDVPLIRGHMFYPDSPWGLTTISQPQFWRDLGVFRRVYGDGEVGGLISVDVSDWDAPGAFNGKSAKLCSKAEVATEVWEQLKAALNTGIAGEEVLRDDMLHSWHLDDDLDYSAGAPPINSSRLLVHPPGSWDLRPEPASVIDNLVLASDYVRTTTNLASMEGANEAARAAVNTILARAGSQAPRVELWPLRESESFEWWKRLDDRLFCAGRAHLFELLGIRRAGQAAELIRKFTALTGLDKLDDLLDDVRVSELAKSLLGR